MFNSFEILGMFRAWEMVFMGLFAVTGLAIIADGYRRRTRGLPAPSPKTERFGFRVGQTVPYSSRKHPRTVAKIIGFSKRGRMARLLVATHPPVRVVVRRSTRRLSIEGDKLIV